MGISTLFTLLSVPPGYPEQIDVPQTFLHQIDTTFWIWVIRIALAAGLLICLLYANSKEPGKDAEATDQEPSVQEEVDDPEIKEEKEKS